MRTVSLLAALGLVSSAFGAASEAADAAQRRDWQAVRALAGRHSDLNAPQTDGTTALEWAAHWNDVDAVKLLLSSGADPKLANRYGVTPLSEAAAAGNAAIIDMLATLHTATPVGIQVPSRPLELATRQAIDQALASLGVPWNGGPYAEPGRDLLARYERPLRQAFARFDGLLDRVREAGGPYAITHGEPHPGNLLRTPAGLCLVDWGMTALERPERDLWRVISGDQDAARYSSRTGWTVNQDALALYRLRWDLDDVAGMLPKIRGSHQQTADTLVTWTELQKSLEAITR